jgi:hypothetical protein
MQATLLHAALAAPAQVDEEGQGWALKILDNLAGKLGNHTAAPLRRDTATVERAAAAMAGALGALTLASVGAGTGAGGSPAGAGTGSGVVGPTPFRIQLARTATAVVKAVGAAAVGVAAAGQTPVTVATAEVQIGARRCSPGGITAVDLVPPASPAGGLPPATVRLPASVHQLAAAGAAAGGAHVDAVYASFYAARQPFQYPSGPSAVPWGDSKGLSGALGGGVVSVSLRRGGSAATAGLHGAGFAEPRELPVNLGAAAVRTIEQTLGSAAPGSVETALGQRSANLAAGGVTIRIPHAGPGRFPDLPDAFVQRPVWCRRGVQERVTARCPLGDEFFNCSYPATPWVEWGAGLYGKFGSRGGNGSTGWARAASRVEVLFNCTKPQEYPVCRWWDHGAAAEAAEAAGGGTASAALPSPWQASGCYTAGWDANATTCACSHLTEFAALVSRRWDDVVELQPMASDKTTLSDGQQFELGYGAPLVILALLVLYGLFVTGALAGQRMDRTDAAKVKIVPEVPGAGVNTDLAAREVLQKAAEHYDQAAKVLKQIFGTDHPQVQDALARKEKALKSVLELRINGAMPIEDAEGDKQRAAAKDERNRLARVALKKKQRFKRQVKAAFGNCWSRVRCQAGKRALSAAEKLKVAKIAKLNKLKAHSHGKRRCRWHLPPWLITIKTRLAFLFKDCDPRKKYRVVVPKKAPSAKLAAQMKIEKEALALGNAMVKEANQKTMAHRSWPDVFKLHGVRARFWAELRNRHPLLSLAYVYSQHYSRVQRVCTTLCGVMGLMALDAYMYSLKFPLKDCAAHTTALRPHWLHNASAWGPGWDVHPANPLRQNAAECRAQVNSWGGEQCLWNPVTEICDPIDRSMSVGLAVTFAVLATLFTLPLDVLLLRAFRGVGASLQARALWDAEKKRYLLQEASQEATKHRQAQLFGVPNKSVAKGRTVQGKPVRLENVAHFQKERMQDALREAPAPERAKHAAGRTAQRLQSWARFLCGDHWWTVGIRQRPEVDEVQLEIRMEKEMAEVEEEYGALRAGPVRTLLGCTDRDILRRRIGKEMVREETLWWELQNLPHSELQDARLLEILRGQRITPVQRYLYELNRINFDALPRAIPMWRVAAVYGSAAAFIVGCTYYVFQFALERSDDMQALWLGVVLLSLLQEAFLVAPLKVLLLHAWVPTHVLEPALLEVVGGEAYEQFVEALKIGLELRHALTVALAGGEFGGGGGGSDPAAQALAEAMLAKHANDHVDSNADAIAAEVKRMRDKRRAQLEANRKKGLFEQLEILKVERSGEKVVVHSEVDAWIHVLAAAMRGLWQVYCYVGLTVRIAVFICLVLCLALTSLSIILVMFYSDNYFLQ